MSERRGRIPVKEFVKSFFKTRKQEGKDSADLLEERAQRDVAVISKLAHEQVIAELRQERDGKNRATALAHEQVIAELRQERDEYNRATAEGMPEYPKNN
jgi:hypothetical protein